MAPSSESTAVEWTAGLCRTGELALANCSLTPHIAARVPQAVENMCDVVYYIIAMLQGKKPKFPTQEGSY